MKACAYSCQHCLRYAGVSEFGENFSYQCIIQSGSKHAVDKRKKNFNQSVYLLFTKFTVATNVARLVSCFMGTTQSALWLCECSSTSVASSTVVLAYATGAIVGWV